MTSQCWALVPVNTRALCKTRLAGRLAADSRLLLVRLMLERALTALRESRTVDRVAVVSPERDTVPADVPMLPDRGGGLNDALEAARQTLIERGARELVVLQGDLPLVTADDIDRLVESGRRSGFALATDAAGTGTNALFVTLTVPFRFQFGPGSRFLHMDEAARVGLQAQLLRADGFALDVDGPADLAELLDRGEPSYRSLTLCAPEGAPANTAPVTTADTG